MFTLFACIFLAVVCGTLTYINALVWASVYTEVVRIVRESRDDY